MIKRIVMTGLIANVSLIPQAFASGTAVSGAKQAAHGTWYWLVYSAAILLFGFAIYIMSGARMKRRVNMLRVALQTELDKVNSLLSEKYSSDLTEPRAGHLQESRIQQLNELKSRLLADLKELNRSNISVFNLVALSSIAKRFTAEKRTIRAQLQMQNG
ncbi:hypothetical protein P4H66_12980 [Paenibacillus dokdonensis]|uniref:Uncharacterized protein n=1 Tax=Paenibacillus dokdonensis TaxID=2567944 RepID=A0ABU6GMV1_9BACL|nr:hypothetical protein [Paenibacillus dokdonensis]MEC0240763.1 hypothetical protein [Paenibacillus dokdonensis]